MTRAVRDHLLAGGIVRLRVTTATAAGPVTTTTTLELASTGRDRVAAMHSAIDLPDGVDEALVELMVGSVDATVNRCRAVGQAHHVELLPLPA